MESTFIIIREDLQVDPVTIVAEGLLVGRLPTCEVLLNHPSVSRLHAGITNAESDFYIRNLRPANPILLNGEKLEDYQALAAGDVLGVGPFALNIDIAQGALVIKVSLQIAATAGGVGLQSAGRLLGQAYYRGHQNDQAFSTFSFAWPALGQGPVRLDADYGSDTALAAVAYALGRNSGRPTNRGRRALLRLGIHAGANL